MTGALADPAEVSRRRALLDSAHMRALAAYVRGLNAQGRGWAPDFDPLDGGVRARLLLVLEKPGPGLHSGFVSRDNDTPTARAIRTFMQQAAVPREGMAIWNAVPWWNGTMALRQKEIRAGATEFSSVLALLPDLRCVVLAGRSAQALARCPGAGITVVSCVHPSPQARAGPASSAAWHTLPDIWRDAWAVAASKP